MNLKMLKHVFIKILKDYLKLVICLAALHVYNYSFGSAGAFVGLF